MQMPATRTQWVGRIGRILLGFVVGASFGIAIGALVASWVYGVEAIEDRAVEASYLAAGITIAAAMVGAFFGYRSGATPDQT